MILQQKPVVEYSSFPSSASYNSTCSGQTALYTAYRRGARCAFPSKEHAGNRPYPFNVTYSKLITQFIKKKKYQVEKYIMRSVCRYVVLV